MIDQYQNPTNITIYMKSQGTNSAALRGSVDDPFAIYGGNSYSGAANWFTLSAAVVTAGGTTVVNLNQTLRAVQLQVFGTTSGNILLTYVQGGMQA